MRTVCVAVLQEYARRQSTKPKRHPGMEPVKQPDDRDSQCTCLRAQVSDGLCVTAITAIKNFIPYNIPQDKNCFTHAF